MDPKNKLELLIPDKYLKCNFYNPTEDDKVIGAIKYMRDQGKTCEFLGFNEIYKYVLVIDGIKYYGDVNGQIDTNYYATLYVVDDAEHDYKENHLKRRVDVIQDYIKI